jgi:hypothetical protein
MQFGQRMGGQVVGGICVEYGVPQWWLYLLQQQQS